MKLFKADVKVGDLLKATWGATMSYTDYYQVVSIKGARVQLTTPKAEVNGNQSGTSKIIAPATDLTVTRNAKFTAGGLKLCERLGSKNWKGEDQSWKVGRSYWDYLHPAKVGEIDHFYGD